jgi:hypothetical protein
MTRPTPPPLADQGRRPRLQQRFVARRVQFMEGRVSEYAADRQLRSLECRLVANLGALLLAAAAGACSVLDQGPATFGCVVAAIAWTIAWYVAGYRYGRAAALDIVRAAGLPDHAWRKVRGNTPKQFDAWLSRAQYAAEVRP